MKIPPRIFRIDTIFGETVVALYLLRGEKNTIIDAGTAASPLNDIAPALAKINLKLPDIDLLVNTHGHLDHTGGNAAVRATGAAVRIHSGDTLLIEDHERYFREYLGRAVTAIRGEEYFEEEKANYLAVAGPDMAADSYLEDNEVISLGNGCDLRVIHLPGHSAGSVGFYWEQEEILFYGDSLQGLGREGGGLPILEDLIDYEASLERLRQLPIRLSFTAHDFRGLTLPPAFTRQDEEAGKYLEECLEFTWRMIEAMEKVAPQVSGRPVPEVYDRVVAELPATMGFESYDRLPRPFFSATTVFFTLPQFVR